MMLTKEKQKQMESLALKVREHIIQMSTGGGCFIGASLSCVELIVYLYSEWLRTDKDNLKSIKRDYLFLSKGHDVPALYGTLAELGFFPVERLKNHLNPLDNIYWHPNRNIPGVEFHSGSLGHLPAVAAGVALDVKIKKAGNRVVVITGDGELNEGSIWETLLVANAFGLDNLTLVVDRNQFQANAKTEDLIPLEPLQHKFISFGCNVIRTEGHDFTALDLAFEHLQKQTGKVKVIIADTTRGKGLPSIEAKANRWFCSFTDEEAINLMKELHGNSGTILYSETLTVR